MSREMATALVTGVTGQDGSYLTELLLDKGYEVHGVIRRSSSFNTDRLEHMYRDPHDPSTRLFLHFGDLTDVSSLRRILEEVQPDEIYNLGAQSHVQGLLRPARLHGAGGRAGDAPAPGGDARPSGPDRASRPLLPGRVLRDVRVHSPATGRGLPVPSTLAVRRQQGGGALVRDQLPRVLRPVHLERHPVQPRVAPARRDVRDAQGDPRRGQDRRGTARQALPGEPGRAPGLGTREGLRARASG